MHPWQEFEQNVANLFRASAQEVQENVLLGGEQIDVLVFLRSSGVTIRLVVDCKCYSKRAGKKQVTSFVPAIRHLRDANLADFGAIVSRTGFTPNAWDAARKHPIKLLSPSDIFELRSFPATDSRRQSFGSEAIGSETLAMIDIIDGAEFDPQHNRFWHLVMTLTRARKFAPDVTQEHLWSIWKQCKEIGEWLGSVHRATVLVLEGILLYDSSEIEMAEQRFVAASEVAKKEGIMPTLFQTLLWHGRCLAQKRDFTAAIDLIEQGLTESRREPSLANWRTRATYWLAKIHWMAYSCGVGRVPPKQIQQQFWEVMDSADELGLINYREGARARLGEIALAGGNAREAYRLFLLSKRLTPNIQDRQKLKDLIEDTRQSLPLYVAKAVEKGVEAEPDLQPVRIPRDEVHPMVQVCDHALWRYAKYPKNRILPYVLNPDAGWLEGMRNLLEDEELILYCINADRYQRDSNGVRVDIGTRKYRSLCSRLRASSWKPEKKDLLRRLRMCKKLFLTAALVSDTGKNGSISLVPLSTNAKGSVVEHIEKHFVLGSNYDFAFQYGTVPRLLLTDDLRDKLRQAVVKLTSEFVAQSRHHGVFPVSADFFFDESGFNFLEFHYPSRGFEVLYSPFRDLVSEPSFPLEIYARLIGQFVDQSNAACVVLAHLDELVDDASRPRSAFYGFEFARIAEILNRTLRQSELIMCNKWSQAVRRATRVDYEGKTPDLVILDDMNPEHLIYTEHPQVLLPDGRMVLLASDRKIAKDYCKALEIPTSLWIHIRPETGVDFDSISAQLGPFVVVKDRFHLPSWHAKKHRVEFLDLRDPIDQQILLSRSKTTDILVERLVTSSSDSLGHCGEIRIHGCAIA